MQMKTFVGTTDCCIQITNLLHWPALCRVCRPGFDPQRSAPSESTAAWSRRLAACSATERCRCRSKTLEGWLFLRRQLGQRSHRAGNRSRMSFSLMNRKQCRHRVFQGVTLGVTMGRFYIFGCRLLAVVCLCGDAWHGGTTNQNKAVGQFSKTLAFLSNLQVAFTGLKNIKQTWLCQWYTWPHCNNGISVCLCVWTCFYQHKYQ